MSLHHKLCHVLGGSFDLPHAQTHAIVLPHATAYNAAAAPEAMMRIARALGAPNTAFGLYDLVRHRWRTHDRRPDPLRSDFLGALSNLSQYNSLYLLILGVIAIAMMLFLPKGIWGGAVGRKGMQLFPTHRYLIRDE
jgi:ABC-type branched-subunit amino acid transport system permease subunit